MRSFVADASSHVDRMIFNFRNRRALDSVSDYERRQTRMVTRQMERARSASNVEFEQAIGQRIASGDVQEQRQAEAEYLDHVYDDAIQQYADYFETEGEEDLQYLREGNRTDVSTLMLGYRDYTKIGTETRGYFSIPKRQWNNRLGLARNMVEEFRDYTGYVVPKLEQMTNLNQSRLITERNAQNALSDVEQTAKLFTEHRLPGKDGEARD